jgi:hypothetical protein
VWCPIPEQEFVDHFADCCRITVRLLALVNEHRLFAIVIPDHALIAEYIDVTVSWDSERCDVKMKVVPLKGTHPHTLLRPQRCTYAPPQWFDVVWCRLNPSFNEIVADDVVRHFFLAISITSAIG